MEQTGWDFIESGSTGTAPAPGAPITLVRGYLTQEQQSALLGEAAHYPYDRPEISLFNRRLPIPRTQVWFGDSGCDYRYSGLFIRALPWPRYASKLRDKLKRDFGLRSNGVLVNRYRDGSDSMGWHSDDEPEIAPGSDIASLTLGATRDFVLRHKQTGSRHRLSLESGDLLIMHWPMQAQWQHALPRRLRVTAPRWNYTFRQLIPGFHD
jgi:alkylated DNA repair dioxygenase AlkB